MLAIMLVVMLVIVKFNVGMMDWISRCNLAEETIGKWIIPGRHQISIDFTDPTYYMTLIVVCTITMLVLYLYDKRKGS